MTDLDNPPWIARLHYADSTMEDRPSAHLAERLIVALPPHTKPASNSIAKSCRVTLRLGGINVEDRVAHYHEESRVDDSEDRARAEESVRANTWRVFRAGLKAMRGDEP